MLSKTFLFLLQMDDLKECICIMDYYCYDNNKQVYKGDVLYYKKRKFKYNTRKKVFKVVRQTQMGENMYYIHDSDKNPMISVGEDWFDSHYEIKSVIREEKINKILE